MSANMETAAISKYRSWRETQAAVIKAKEDELARQLQVAVPNNFFGRFFFEWSPYIIRAIIDYGAASSKYRRSDLDSYNFVSLEDLERWFDELKIAWGGVVEISVYWDGNSRFEVTFTAV